MRASYNSLFTVSFLHEYFADKRFTGFGVKPVKETADEILKNGLLLRSFQNGFSVFYDKFYFGEERSKDDILNGELKLTFSLELLDQNFYNYTAAFDADIGELNFYFTNLPGMSCQAEKGNYLHRDEYASAKDLVIKDQDFNSAFAKVVVLTDKNLRENYLISFKQQAAYLRYFLVSDYFLALEQPAIVDNTNQQKFSDALAVTMTNGQKAICFKSDNMISFTDKAKSNFNLVENFEKETGKFKMVRSGLPLPNVRYVSKALDTDGSRQGDYFSDIFL